MIIRAFVFAGLLACCGRAALAQNTDRLSVDLQEPSQTIVASGVVFDPVQIAWLQDRFDVWLVLPDGRVDVMLLASELAMLKASGLDFKVNQTLTDSVQKVGRRLPQQVLGIAGFPCYRTVEETYQRMDELAALYPNLVRVQDFGDSYLRSIGQGGYPMRALIIENTATADPKAPFMLIGAIHAREYTTAESTLRFAESLLTNYNIDADSTWLVNHRKIVIVPQMNPDGRKRAETGVSWRRNVRPGCATATQIGVDLNRNSSFLWGTNNGSSTSQCSDTYRGTSAASEPEVQAMQSLMAQTFTDQRGPALTDAAPVDATGVFMSLHAYADLVLFPWGAQATAAPNQLGLQTLARKMGFYTQYKACQPPVAGCLYAASGTSDDYSYGEFGVASMTFELGNQGFFESCSIYEGTTLGKILPALKYLAKSARRPYQEAAGPEVINATVTNNTGGWVIQAQADDTRSRSGDASSDPVHTIQSAALYLSPPWLAGASAIAMQASDATFNGSVEALRVELPAGTISTRTLAYLVATDSSGTAGVPTAVWLEVGGDGVFANGFE
jgi:carboxypeptidase T